MSSIVRRASPIEQQFWILDQQGMGSAYNVISAFVFQKLNLERFAEVVKSVVREHDIFNCNYNYVDGELLCQRSDVDDFVFIKNYDDSSEDHLSAMQWIKEQSQCDFDLQIGPLIKVLIASFNDSEHCIVSLVFHHIVIDLKTKDILAQIISERYKKHLTTYDLTDTNNYADYSADVSTLGPMFDKCRDYWSKNLIDVNRQVVLAPSSKQNQSYSSFVDLNVDIDLWADIARFAKSNTTSEYIVLLSAYFQILAKFSSEKDFCVAVPLSNRKNQSYKNTLGCFVNTVPLRISIEAKDNFLEVIQKVRKALLGAHRYQELPSMHIFEEANKVSSKGPLYKHGFTFEHPMALSLNDSPSEAIIINTKQSQLDIFLRCWECDDQLKGQIECGAGYGVQFAQRFVESFKVLLKNAIAVQGVPLTSVPCLSSVDTLIIDEANSTLRDYEVTSTLKSLFESQVEKTPNAIAILIKDDCLTYLSFNERVNQLCHYLIQSGIKATDKVAILFERSLEMMEAIYSITKIGATYLPIDIELPEDRVNYMIANAEASLVLTSAKVMSNIRLNCESIISLDSIRPKLSNLPTSNPDVKVGSDSAAYIIYTSGSTGAPKGVVNSQSGICNRLLWMQDQFSLGESDVVLQKTPYSFDVSVWEIFWPLQVGATLAVAEHNSHKDPYQLDSQIHKYNVSFIHFVPAMLASYLSIEPNESTKALKTVVCSGEELTVGLQNRFHEVFNQTRLYNLYGPTEAAVDVTCWECTPKSEGNSVPIGRPIANTQIHIVDEYANPLPVGVMGELWISGVQVATGYVNNPELSAEKFVKAPNALDRVYKTGDYARWNEQGAIEFLGRKDFQVKLNGVRIELAEIENTLLSYFDIENSVVQPFISKTGTTILVAYYSRGASQGAIDKRLLLEYLSEKLPPYMIPAQFIYVEDFVLSSSGKIDRKQLPEFEPTKSESNSSIELTDCERQISNVWGEVLGLESFEIHDSFFDVGGNSLTLMNVFSKLKSNHPKLTSVDLFAYPTISALAKFLGGISVAQSSTKSRASKIRQATGKMGRRVRK